MKSEKTEIWKIKLKVQISLMMNCIGFPVTLLHACR